MTRFATRLAASALAIGLTLTASARAQDFGAKPTKEHEILNQDVGTWDAAIKTWMGGPDAEPSVSKGVETVTLFGDGLWVLSKFEGDFAGTKFEGHSQRGYNARKKKYVGTWIDSMTDSISNIEGTYDEKTRTMTSTVEMVNPATGEPYKAKQVEKHLDDDTRLFTMFMPGPDGKDVKSMEIRYTKRK